MQKHLEYHLQLHAQPDAFACDIDDCGKQFSNPSSLRIHKLLDHERPDEVPRTGAVALTRTRAMAPNLSVVRLKTTAIRPIACVPINLPAPFGSLSFT